MSVAEDQLVQPLAAEASASPSPDGALQHLTATLSLAVGSGNAMVPLHPHVDPTTNPLVSLHNNLELHVSQNI